MPRVPKASAKKTSKTKKPTKTSKRKAPRKKTKSFETELKAIYKENGKMPNLTKLDKNRSSRMTRFLIRFIVIALILAAVAWAGFLFFNPFGGADGQSLEILIDGPEQVTSGEEVSFEIKYDNNGRVPMAALEIQLNLPETFYLSEANPAPTKDEDTWTVGSLKKGGKGTIELTGVILGSVNTTSTIQAIVTYRPSNFNADFQDIETMEFTIDNSVVETALASPSKAVPGDVIEYKLELTNTSESALENIFVGIHAPNSWIIESTSPELVEEKLYWLVSKVESEETIELTLTGSFAAEAQGLQDVTFVSYFEDAEGVQLTQTTDRAQTDVLGSDLVVQTIINGSSSDQSASPGDTLRMSINYSNSGEEVVGGVVISVTFSSENGQDVPIQWENADISGGYFDPVENEITWGPNSTPDLATLEVGEEGVIDLSLPILDDLDPETLADQIVVAVESSLNTIGGVNSPRELSSSPITISINSDFNPTAESRYYNDNGSALGSGPMPPEVNEITSYQIIWSVDNSIHELEDVVLSTTLPLDVAWTGSTSTDIGQLSYDPESRVARWSIDSLPTSIESVTADFEVSITPEEADVGSFVKLSNRISVTATDTVTGDNLTRSLDELSTNLVNDTYAAGQGIVIE